MSSLFHLNRVAYMYNNPPLRARLVMCLAMSLLVVILLQEEMLVRAVCRECHCCDSQTWETALKSVPPREGA
jgi:hypothetical protein